MMDKKISLKSIVGEELLNKIQDSYLKYLESSAAIYEVNGDYAASLFSSKYCDFLNQASKKLAGKTDEEALKSGRWICHEDCWATSLKSIKDRKPCEVECSGGIRIYAAPIIANDMVIGSNNAGVSNPPTDEKKIREIAEKYKVDPKKLLKISKEYVPRPEYVSNAAKSHIETAAEEIAEIFIRKRADEEIILRKKAEEKAKQAADEWSETFNAIADFLFIQDKEFKFIKVNKAFADALKVKPEELIGEKCHNLLHKSGKPWPNCPAVQTLNDKKPHTEEVIDPNIGIPLLVSTSPIFNDEGEVIAIVHYAKDITERKNAEIELNKYRSHLEELIKEKTEDLRKSEEQLRLASESANIGMWFWNVKTGELIWTDICKKLFGLPPDKKMSYEVFLEALHPDDRQPTDKAVKKSLDEHKDYNVEYRSLWPDSSMHWLNAVGKPYYDAAGNIESLVGIVIDIDAVKKQRIELQEKLNELERFRQATVEREFRMKELRYEIERLKTEKK